MIIYFGTLQGLAFSHYSLVAEDLMVAKVTINEFFNRNKTPKYFFILDSSLDHVLETVYCPEQQDLDEWIKEDYSKVLALQKQAILQSLKTIKPITK